MNEDTLRAYLHDPVLFVEEVIGVTPTAQQLPGIQSIGRNPATAIKSGHGTGKTAIEAWSIIWFLALHPYSKVPCTAPTGHQLDDILWPEIKYWSERSALRHHFTWTKTRFAVKGYEDAWFAVPRSAAKPENLQGFHAKHCFFVIDEASGMDQGVMDVVEGALTNDGARLLMCGNPTQLSGTFYNAFHRDRSLYKLMTFNAEESALVSPDYMIRIASKYGRDSDVYMVRVLGEFPKGTPDTFIKLTELEPAIERTVPGQGPWCIGVDPARYGDDSSVICFRHGYKVYPLESFHGINTTRLTGMVMAAVKDIRKMDPDAGIIKINVDDTGVGGGVTDQLQEMELSHNIEVFPQNNGGAGDEDYFNQGAAMWGNIKDLLPELELPEHDDLVSQLSTRKYKITPDGKIRLEDKEAMKKRGLHSPDDADALSLCLWDDDSSGIVIL